MAIRVFLADDHAVIRDGLRLLLEAEEDIIIAGEAADGKQTVHKIKQLCPDVVIMDISMPELNGIEAAILIRKVCPSTQILILSMHASNEYISQALKAGVRGYLLKESAGKEVVNAVRSVHSGKRYLSQHITETVIDQYLERVGTSSAKSPMASLSSREREILKHIVEGKSNAEIARLLSLSVKTVETYKSRLMTKLNIKDLPGLIKFAIQHGLTTLK